MKYFAFVLLITGALAVGVAAEIRTHVHAALREAETQYQLKQVEHELQIARSIPATGSFCSYPAVPGGVYTSLSEISVYQQSSPAGLGPDAWRFSPRKEGGTGL